MRIKEIYIYGFGQLENLEIKDLHNFHVFYGENEAGKSTISAFIHAVLFGFPTKQQTELRYEPKNQAKYGGNLKVFIQGKGDCLIERVKGKAAGDVSVTLSDGTRGGEELLKELLLRVDKSLFQAIFSFSLHGLQNIHHMKNEELGRFLFSAGTLGTNKLAYAENELQKELDARFKPNGKKPLLNEKLQDLHQLGQELKKAAQKNHQFEQLVVSKQDLETKIKALQQTLSQEKHKVQRMVEWEKIKPIVIEEIAIQEELSTTRDIHFPLKGVERLEKLLLIKSPNEAKLSSVNEKLKSFKVQLEALEPNQELLAHETSILEAIEQIPLHNRLMSEEKLLETKLVELDEKLNELNDQLSLPIEESDILTINTNIFIKQQAEDLQIQEQKLANKKKYLDDRFVEEKNALETIEKEIQLYKGELLSEEKRTFITNQLNEGTNKDKIDTELNLIQEKIKFFKQNLEKEKIFLKRTKQQKQFFSIFIIVTCLFIAGIGAYLHQWMATGGAIFFLGLLFALLKKNKQSSEGLAIDQTLKELLEREAFLLSKANSLEINNDISLIKDLEKDNELREQIKLFTLKWESQNGQYEKVISQFEDWELEKAEYDWKLSELKKLLSLPEYITGTFLLEGLQVIENYKLTLRVRNQTDQKRNEVKFQTAELLDCLKRYNDIFLPGLTFDVQKCSFMLRQRLKEEIEKQIQHDGMKAKVSEAEEENRQLVIEQKYIQDEIQKLLDEAKAVNIEEFLKKGHEAERRSKLLDRMVDLRRQIKYSSLKNEEVEAFLLEGDVAAFIQEMSRKIEGTEAKIPLLQDELARIKYEIQLLEEGGTYSELLHAYKQKKYEVEEEAKTWTAFRLAQDMLSRTIEKYKNQRLPQMIAKAEEYLSFLTDGNYRRIHMKSSGTGFLIERADRTVFEANELSQATTEQVYVSLRLSLATTLYEKYHFPIMIDDSFVNFDHKRTAKMVDLLKSLQNNQILFFTCHRHMLDYFCEDDILQLGKGKVMAH